MKPNPATVALLCISLVVLGFVSYRVGSTDQIDYRGQKVKLRKAYWSYDDYKADPQNLAPEELPRVEKMIADAALPSTFANSEEFSQAVYGLRFPGYGAGKVGEKALADGSALFVLYVEIPGLQKYRYVAAQGTKAGVRLVDSTLLEVKQAAVSDFRLEEKKLTYLDKSGNILIQKQISS